MLLGLAFLVSFAGVGIWQWQAGEERSEINGVIPAGDLGIMEEMNFMLSADEIGRRQQQALSGDVEAAKALSNHYSQIGQRREERRWALLAANRGDCGAMSLLRGAEMEAGDTRAAARWNDMLRQNRCTIGKAYPDLIDARLKSMPLWNEQ